MITDSELWAAIEQARKDCGLIDDDIPAGAVTVVQYAKRYGIGRYAAASQLEKMVGSGVMDSGFKKVADPGGAKRTRFFWVKT